MGKREEERERERERACTCMHEIGCLTHVSPKVFKDGHCYFFFLFVCLQASFLHHFCCLLTMLIANPCTSTPPAVANGDVSSCINVDSGETCIPECRPEHYASGHFECLLGSWQGSSTCIGKEVDSRVGDVRAWLQSYMEVYCANTLFRLFDMCVLLCINVPKYLWCATSVLRWKKETRRLFSHAHHMRCQAWPLVFSSLYICILMCDLISVWDR